VKEVDAGTDAGKDHDLVSEIDFHQKELALKICHEVKNGENKCRAVDVWKRLM
jgi:hypothetical protein